MLSMLDTIARQIPEHEKEIEKAARIVKTYLQVRLDQVGADINFVSEFEHFLTRVPDFYAAELKDKLTRHYSHTIALGWTYNLCGYLEKNFYDVPEPILNAYHVGFLLAGYKFGDKVQDLTLKVQGSTGEVILDTRLRLVAFPAYRDSLYIMEMVEGLENRLT